MDCILRSELIYYLHSIPICYLHTLLFMYIIHILDTCCSNILVATKVP